MSTAETLRDLANTIWNLLGQINAIRKQAPDNACVVPPHRGNNDPTQSDKPSPHSSMNLFELHKAAAKSFPDGERFEVFYIANTNSMEPVLDDNCIVITEKLNANMLEKDPLQRGDIVIYPWFDKLIIHRLTGAVTDTDGKRVWTIKGDNNYLPDAPVPEPKIKSRVVAIYYGKPMRSED